jgi:hypothetical protein
MSKEQEQTLRDFHFSFAELIADIENFGRLCPIDTLMEMCETLAGIMAEQTEIIAAIEATGSNKIKERFSRHLIGERFYSSHLDALCDMMRLAKHLKELSERKDELLKAMKRMERFDVPPQIDVKLIRSTLEAIPKVKTLKSNE